MPAVRARSVEEYLVCPLRGYLYAFQTAPPSPPQAKWVAGDDDEDIVKATEYPWVSPITTAGSQPLSATLRTRSGTQVTLRGVPDLAAEDRRRRGLAAVIEASRTPRWAPRSRIEALAARVAAYSFIVEACTLIPTVPVIASTHQPWALLPRARAQESLAKSLEGLARAASRGWAEPRSGNHCLHCAYQPLCPAR